MKKIISYTLLNVLSLTPVCFATHYYPKPNELLEEQEERKKNKESFSRNNSSFKYKEKKTPPPVSLPSPPLPDQQDTYVTHNNQTIVNMLKGIIPTFVPKFTAHKNLITPPDQPIIQLYPSKNQDPISYKIRTVTFDLNTKIDVPGTPLVNGLHQTQSQFNLFKKINSRKTRYYTLQSGDIQASYSGQNFTFSVAIDLKKQKKK